MVKRADVMLEWADGTHLFALKGKQIEELEAICFNPGTGTKGIGLGAIYMRVMGGAWHRSDLREVIRLGLIGGGMGAVEAERRCRTYVDDVPLAETMADGASRLTPDSPLAVAQAILSAAVVGVERSEPGESRPGETPVS